jgi:hypothetical protein
MMINKITEQVKRMISTRAGICSTCIPDDEVIPRTL